MSDVFMWRDTPQIVCENIFISFVKHLILKVCIKLYFFFKGFVAVVGAGATRCCKDVVVISTCSVFTFNKTHKLLNR